MPHLDAATYVTQVSWFLTLTLAFYIILQTKVLPTLATLIKLRSRLEKSTYQTEQKVTSTINLLPWPTIERPALTFSFRWKITKPCLKVFRSL